MPKAGMKPVRRRHLIDAPIASIHAPGFADATVARIADLLAGFARARSLLLATGHVAAVLDREGCS